MKKIKFGLFIVLEGGEGVGKTSQAKKLVEMLRSLDYDAIYLREPGGNKVAEDIRNIALYNEIDSITETFLMNAARRINITNNIIPALKDNKIIICDRFTSSTLVYQGFYKNGNIDLIDECNRAIINELINQTNNTMEFTLLCDADVACKRAKEDGHERNKNDILPMEEYKMINDIYKKKNKYLSNIHDPASNLFDVYHQVDTTNATFDEVTNKIFSSINDYIKYSCNIIEE